MHVRNFALRPPVGFVARPAVRGVMRGHAGSHARLQASFGPCDSTPLGWSEWTRPSAAPPPKDISDSHRLLARAPQSRNGVGTPSA